MQTAIVVAGIIVVLIGFTAFFGAPYLPSRRRFITKAFDSLYPISEKDVLFDIGSGDGIVLRMAAERGAKAIGCELNPILFLISKLLSFRHNVEVRLRDFWRSSLPRETTIIYIFSVSRDSKRMTKKLQREVTILNRPIHVMTFGSGLYGVKPIKTLDAYRLYLINPLQSD